MTKRELDLTIESLKIRRCLIETGKPTIRANEARNYNVIPKHLSADQIILLDELTKLIDNLEKKLD
jgi:hypothetical protein